MPLAWVAIGYAAQNQMVSASLEPRFTVPAVTEVCHPHSLGRSATAGSCRARSPAMWRGPLRHGMAPGA
jgi:hypothetical protein